MRVKSWEYMMKRENILISTTAQDAGATAREYGLGVEIAEFCTAWNMDREFSAADKNVRNQIEGINNLTLHGPFNELSAASIDPLVLDITRKRYDQAAKLCSLYGAKKLIIHSGYTSHMYYKCWYEEQAIKFFSNFVKTLPDGVTVVLENVFEDDPGMLINVVKGVDDERFRLCIDVGHVNASLNFCHRIRTNRIGEELLGCADVYEWIKRCAPYTSHYHIHNNYGDRDAHNALPDGEMDMKKLLLTIEKLTPDATLALEVFDGNLSAQWMKSEGLI